MRTLAAITSLAFMLAAGAALAAAHVTETPAQFVKRLYAVYAADSPWWKPGDTKAERRAQNAYEARVHADFYDPTFVKLMNDNDTLAAKKGGGEDLDYDPVCQCQDSGGVYRYVSGQAKGGFFDAVVADNAADQKPWTLVLKKTAAGWRIYDVVDTTGSLRTWLGKHNACLRAARTEKQGEACIS